MTDHAHGKASHVTKADYVILSLASLEECGTRTWHRSNLHHITTLAVTRSITAPSKMLRSDVPTLPEVDAPTPCVRPQRAALDLFQQVRLFG